MTNRKPNPEELVAAPSDANYIKPGPKAAYQVYLERHRQLTDALKKCVMNSPELAAAMAAIKALEAAREAELEKLYGPKHTGPGFTAGVDAETHQAEVTQPNATYGRFGIGA